MSIWPCLKCKEQTHISLLDAGLCHTCLARINDTSYTEEDSSTANSGLNIECRCYKCGVKIPSDRLKSGLCDIHMKEDVINKPKHYNFATIEPIDVIEDWKLDFRLANALKYISRAGKKDPAKAREDLQKAIWYINRYIIKELPDDKQTK